MNQLNIVFSRLITHQQYQALKKMKKKIVFIINPISGLGRQKKIESLAYQVVDKKIFDIKFNTPKLQNMPHE